MQSIQLNSQNSEKFFTTLTVEEFLQYTKKLRAEEWFYHPNEKGYPFTVENIVSLRIINECAKQIRSCFQKASSEVEDFAEGIFKEDPTLSEGRRTPSRGDTPSHTVTHISGISENLGYTKKIHKICIRSNETFQVLKREYGKLKPDAQNNANLTRIVQASHFANSVLLGEAKKLNL